MSDSDNMDYVLPTDDALRQREKDWSNFYVKYSTNQTDDQSEYDGSDLSAMGREAMVSEPESVSPERFVASDKRDGDDDGSDQDEPMDIAKATQNWQVACQRRLAGWKADGLDVASDFPDPDPLTTSQDRIQEWLMKSLLPAAPNDPAIDTGMSNVTHHHSTSTMTSSSLIHQSHGRHQQETRHTKTVTTIVQRVLFRSGNGSCVSLAPLQPQLLAIQSPASDNVFEPPPPTSTAKAAPVPRQNLDKHRQRKLASVVIESSDDDEPTVAAEVDFQLPRSHRPKRSPTVFRKTPFAMQKPAGRTLASDGDKTTHQRHQLQHIVDRLPQKSCLKGGTAIMDVVDTRPIKKLIARRDSSSSSDDGEEDHSDVLTSAASDKSTKPVKSGSSHHSTKRFDPKATVARGAAKSTKSDTKSTSNPSRTDPDNAVKSSSTAKHAKIPECHPTNKHAPDCAPTDASGQRPKSSQPRRHAREPTRNAHGQADRPKAIQRISPKRAISISSDSAEEDVVVLLSAKAFSKPDTIDTAHQTKQKMPKPETIDSHVLASVHTTIREPHDDVSTDLRSRHLKESKSQRTAKHNTASARDAAIIIDKSTKRDTKPANRDKHGGKENTEEMPASVPADAKHSRNPEIHETAKQSMRLPTMTENPSGGQSAESTKTMVGTSHRSRSRSLQRRKERKIKQSAGDQNNRMMNKHAHENLATDVRHSEVNKSKSTHSEKQSNSSKGVVGSPQRSRSRSRQQRDHPARDPTDHTKAKEAHKVSATDVRDQKVKSKPSEKPTIRNDCQPIIGTDEAVGSTHQSRSRSRSHRREKRPPKHSARDQPHHTTTKEAHKESATDVRDMHVKDSRTKHSEKPSNRNASRIRSRSRHRREKRPRKHSARVQPHQTTTNNPHEESAADVESTSKQSDERSKQIECQPIESTEEPSGSSRPTRGRPRHRRHEQQLKQSDCLKASQQKSSMRPTSESCPISDVSKKTEKPEKSKNVKRRSSDSCSVSDEDDDDWSKKNRKPEKSKKLTTSATDAANQPAAIHRGSVVQNDDLATDLQKMQLKESKLKTRENSSKQTHTHQPKQLATGRNDRSPSAQPQTPSKIRSPDERVDTDPTIPRDDLQQVRVLVRKLPTDQLRKYNAKPTPDMLTSARNVVIDSPLAMPPPLKIPPRSRKVATAKKTTLIVSEPHIESPEIPHRPIASTGVFNTNNTLTVDPVNNVSANFKNQLHSTANVAQTTSTSFANVSALPNASAMVLPSTKSQHMKRRRYPNMRSIVLYDPAMCPRPPPLGSKFRITIGEIADRMNLTVAERRDLFKGSSEETRLEYPADAAYSINWVPKPPPGQKPAHLFDSSDSSDEEDILDWMDRRPWIEEI